MVHRTCFSAGAWNAPSQGHSEWLGYIAMGNNNKKTFMTLSAN